MAAEDTTQGTQAEPEFSTGANLSGESQENQGPGAPEQPGQSQQGEGVAADGGTTTKDDATDASVKAVSTGGDEPQGPEDALGPGPKRGDYRERQPEGAVHMRSVPIPDSELGTDEQGAPLDGQPLTRMEVQNQHVHNIGDVPGKKGGVDTAHDDQPENAPDAQPQQ